MSKPRPLVTRLRCARSLVREWRTAFVDSYRNADGALSEPNAYELARFNEAYAALTEAIKKESRNG